MRELLRIKRDRDERKLREEERTEIERRSKLTELEREQENALLGTDDN